MAEGVAGSHGDLSLVVISTLRAVDVVLDRDGASFGFRLTGANPVKIDAVDPSSPAHSAGLRPGDTLWAVNDVRLTYGFCFSTFVCIRE